MIPKFRAFVKSGTKQMHGGIYEEDAMVPVGILDITGGEVTVWGCGRENCGMCDDYFRLKDIILMQSTGLLDKNGVEIFEGDIVKNTTQMVYLGHRFEVSWNSAYVCFQLLNRGKTSNVPLIQNFMSYEVIGNIYENPELLEVEE